MREMPPLRQRLSAALIARLPTPCPLCQAAAGGGALCTACAERVRQVRTGLPALRLPGVTQVYAAMAYQDPADVLIWQYKGQGRLSHARLLGDWMLQALTAQQAPDPSAVLVPVPASLRSLRRRGFNPARELSRVLSRRLALPERPAWLERRETPQKQAALDARARRAIRAGVFFCTQPVCAATVYLVDDVVTTGNTAIAAAAALRAAGCKRVDLLVAAQVPERAG